MGNTDKRGWVKLPRSFLNEWWYWDSLMKDIWIHILLTANWEKEPVMMDGHEVAHGQTFFNQTRLAEKLHVTEGAIRSALVRLKNEGCTSKETVKGGVVVTVLDYDNYHGYERSTRSLRVKYESSASLPIIERREEEKNALTRNDSPPAEEDDDLDPPGWEEWFQGEEV